MLEFDGLKHRLYPRPASSRAGSSELTEDTIGVIQFEFADWRSAGRRRTRSWTRSAPTHRRHPRHPGRGDGAARRPADRQADPGAARRARSGRCCPPPRKKVAGDPRRSIPTSATSTTASRCPASTGRSSVDKAEAAKYGAGVSTVGTARAARHQRRRRSTEYRPADSDKSVDILGALPGGPPKPRPDRRAARCRPASGSVPIGNFVEREPAQRVGYINRVAGNRVMTVAANIAEGVQTAKVQQDITAGARRTPDLGHGRHVEARRARTRSARRPAPS